MAAETFHETSNRRSRPTSGTPVDVRGPVRVTSCHFPDAAASPAREH